MPFRHSGHYRPARPRRTLACRLHDPSRVSFAVAAHPGSRRRDGAVQAQASGPGDRTVIVSQPVPARRVVIAEDEAIIRLDLREMLEEEGWAVVGEAGDGESAVRLVEQLRPDLVLLDVQMPVLDGLAAAERIARARTAPVVMLTAFGQRELVERAREAGAMAYLVKPFAKKDLMPAIEMAVSRYAEIVGLEAEVSGLHERLEARKAVERAKGVLQSEHGLTEPQAFRWIQTTSMNRRMSMRAVAEAVLGGAAAPGGAVADGATLEGSVVRAGKSAAPTTGAATSEDSPAAG